MDQYDDPEVVGAANSAGVEIVGTPTTHHYDDHWGKQAKSTILFRLRD